MTTQIITNSIHDALVAMNGGDFSEAATNLLATMGYRSQRIPAGQTGEPRDFIRQYNDDKPDTKSRQAFLDNARSVRILFQYTDAEIRTKTQGSLFEDADFYSGNARSFIFAAVELQDDTYPRGQYAMFTRELNKLIQIPIVALFRTPTNRVTLAFVHRRPNKLDSTRDVLGRVSLIREIDAADPHRAHLDILADLSLAERLKWMDNHGKPHNFDGLLDAWLDALDTEELNRRFYRDLFGWFQAAVETARFPANTIPDEEHVIRLITRLLFVWFIKEKGLVAEDLFIENQVSELLKDYDRADGDSYYRAILQNLFFATLNTDIGERRFSRRNYDDHRDPSLYRYRNEMADPDRLMTLFRQTPFINGGLFDCLDTFEGSRAGGVRIDCFTDNVNDPKRLEYRILSIPNRLFFGDDGLITLFNRYKFTVEENTPADTEVALDPELLGKVFENLLAAFNPETRENARKQTGSYYTPRAVVDYMVDEALVASLLQNVDPANKDTDWWEDRLRYLLDYTDGEDASEFFVEGERKRIINAIAGLRVLDPAVGSGAFPMGMLHKLTLALRRLDPHNEIWEDLQRKLAGNRASDSFYTSNQAERDAELQEISATFQRYRDSDLGRKLYLIQNSIYGVDIQPVATQIAKLRFFISLAIEQQSTDDANDNYGIKPLPNLETRFVAANTLIRLGKATQVPLGGRNKVTELNDQLRQNRERHFHAGTRAEKLRLRREDARLRELLKGELRKAGMSTSDAGKVAGWDPYDQNASANWFDPQYMFGVKDGFDVIIGNPPYINVQNLSNDMRSYLFSNYQACEKRTDIYIAFLEKSLASLDDIGTMCFILPSAFTKQQYATKMRQTLIDNHTIRELVDASSYRIFENAVVYNVVLTVDKKKNQVPTRIRIHHSNSDFEERKGIEFAADQMLFRELKDSRLDTNPSIEDAIGIKDKIWQSSVRFDQICLVAYGARLNSPSKKVRKNHYISAIKSAGSKRFCEGRNIERYSFSQDGWLKYRPDEHYNPMFPELFENDKLMFINVVSDKLRFAYDKSGFYNSHTVVNCVRLDLLTKASHRTATRAVRNAELSFASKFDYRFLIAILNSQLSNWYFLNFLSEDLHFYPNDAKQMPIPKIPAAEQRPFIRLVDQILEAKAADPNADTSELEESIDWLVYDLYDLTDEETAVIADYFWDGDMSQEEEDAVFVKMMEEALEEEGVISREEIMAILRGEDEG